MTTPTSFEPFPRLPAELQLKIWEMAAAEMGPGPDKPAGVQRFAVSNTNPSRKRSLSYAFPFANRADIENSTRPKIYLKLYENALYTQNPTEGSTSPLWVQFTPLPYIIDMTECVIALFQPLFMPLASMGTHRYSEVVVYLPPPEREVPRLEYTWESGNHSTYMLTAGLGAACVDSAHALMRHVSKSRPTSRDMCVAFRQHRKKKLRLVVEPHKDLFILSVEDCHFSQRWPRSDIADFLVSRGLGFLHRPIRTDADRQRPPTHLAFEFDRETWGNPFHDIAALAEERSPRALFVRLVTEILVFGDLNYVVWLVDRRVRRDPTKKLWARTRSTVVNRNNRTRVVEHRDHRSEFLPRTFVDGDGQTLVEVSVFPKTLPGPSASAAWFVRELVTSFHMAFDRARAAQAWGVHHFTQNTAWEMQFRERTESVVGVLGLAMEDCWDGDRRGGSIGG